MHLLTPVGGITVKSRHLVPAVVAVAFSAVITACGAAPARDDGESSSAASTTTPPPYGPDCVYPVPPSEGGGTRARCPDAFDSRQCTNEGPHGSTICGCAPLAGPPRNPQAGDACIGAVDRPHGLEACTEGMLINAGKVWLCPTSVVLPDGIHRIVGNPVSNCVGNAAPDTVFVVKPVPTLPDAPPGCHPGEPKHGCDGACIVVDDGLGG